MAHASIFIVLSPIGSRASEFPCLLGLGVFVFVSVVGIESRALQGLDKCSIFK